jgi:hypothetical protein
MAVWDAILFTGIVITVSSSTWSEAEKDEQSLERKLNQPIQWLFLSLFLIRTASTLSAPANEGETVTSSCKEGYSNLSGSPCSTTFIFWRFCQCSCSSMYLLTDMLLSMYNVTLCSLLITVKHSCSLLLKWNATCASVGAVGPMIFVSCNKKRWNGNAAEKKSRVWAQVRTGDL